MKIKVNDEEFHVHALVAADLAAVQVKTQGRLKAGEKVDIWINEIHAFNSEVPSPRSTVEIARMGPEEFADWIKEAFAFWSSV